MDAKEVLTDVYNQLQSILSVLERLLNNARNPGEEADG